MTTLLIIIAIVLFAPKLLASLGTSLGTTNAQTGASSAAQTNQLLGTLLSSLLKPSSGGGGSKGGGGSGGPSPGSSNGAGQGTVGSSPDFISYESLTGPQQLELANSWASISPSPAPPSIASVDAAVPTTQMPWPTLLAPDYAAQVSGPSNTQAVDATVIQDPGLGYDPSAVDYSGGDTGGGGDF